MSSALKVFGRVEAGRKDKQDLNALLMEKTPVQ